MRQLSSLALLGLLAHATAQNIGLIYSTVGGNTEMEVKKIAKATGLEPLDIGDITPDDVAAYGECLLHLNRVARRRTPKPDARAPAPFSTTPCAQITSSSARQLGRRAKRRNAQRRRGTISFSTICPNWT